MVLTPFEVLDRATSEFEKRVRQVRDDQWDAPTPCEGWTVRDLVHHVVGADVMAVRLLEGSSTEDAMAVMATDVLGDDHVGAFVSARDAMVSALREERALERTCHHPIGDIPGAQLLGFRIADHTLHAWDLARAIGADEQLDPDLVAAVWQGMQPLAPFIGSMGLFGSGPTGEVPEDAPLQARLLDLAGRRAD
ncbi:MAG: TIGR03086 family protein [Actinobacteria bacterium]|nr:TIGR03086 family protein [Actinomycetota bacterium]